MSVPGGGYAIRSGGDKGHSSLKDGSLQFISDTSPDSGDSLREQEDRDYLSHEETEALRWKEKAHSWSALLQGSHMGSWCGASWKSSVQLQSVCVHP